MDASGVIRVEGLDIAQSEGGLGVAGFDLSRPSAGSEAQSKEDGNVGEGDFGARKGDFYEAEQAGPKWGFGLKIGTFDAPPDAILETGWQGSVHNPRAQKRAQA